LANGPAGRGDPRRLLPRQRLLSRPRLRRRHRLLLRGGYESRRPLGAAERAALPTLAHGAALRFFLTRLYDWGATPVGALVRPKDPMEYERKLAVHRAGVALFEAAP
jgi:Ser/Thr protein kinase RdoA (MazF antagonist)